MADHTPKTVVSDHTPKPTVSDYNRNYVGRCACVCVGEGGGTTEKNPSEFQVRGSRTQRAHRTCEFLVARIKYSETAGINKKCRKQFSSALQTGKHSKIPFTNYIALLDSGALV